MIRLKLDNKFSINKKVEQIHKDMHEYKSEGNDFLGWLEQPEHIDYINDIKSSVDNIKDHDVMVILGIGGSYLGTKMAYDFLREEFSEDKLYFAGWNLSETYITNLIKKLKGKKFALLTISKSGSTLETKLAMDKLTKLAETNIVVTGNESELWKKAQENNWETFILEDNIGGRYSLLTAVSLLPLAYAGFDIDKLVEGQKKALNDLNKPNNDAYLYASARFELQPKFPVEMFAVFEPRHTNITEWLKQLFCESEGKQQKGLLATSALYSTDLHSIGQFVQEGNNILFETFIRRNDTKGLEKYNEAVYEGTELAHKKGGKEIIKIEFDNNDEITLGYFTYFMFKAAAMSAYLFNLNPFDQPGVELYKKEIKKIIT